MGIKQESHMQIKGNEVKGECVQRYYAQVVTDKSNSRKYIDMSFQIENLLDEVLSAESENVEHEGRVKTPKDERIDVKEKKELESNKVRTEFSKNEKCSKESIY